MLKQVWINLLDNAIKFVLENGVISIDISEGEELTSVSIGNTGGKIPDSELSRIFGKFYQADTSHASEGTGLGLAIVKKIVTLHGGEVSASTDDTKTVFTVRLPQ